MSEKKMDIRTTIVSGVICKRCDKTLPDMTMKDHLEGRFDKECPHTKIVGVFETPTMTWWRINMMIQEVQKLPEKNKPSKKDKTRWLQGCEANKEKSRRVYLAFREYFTDPTSEEYKFCKDMKAIEEEMIADGDDFQIRLNKVFDGLY